MRIQLQPIPATVFVGVVLEWMSFAVSFSFRKRPREAPEHARAASSMMGIALQGLGYASVWSLQRPLFTPIMSVPRAVEIALAVFTFALPIGSIWLIHAAVLTLDKQWSFAARLAEGHKLITVGPYARIRNPIYTGMLGLLVATGLAVSHWIGLLAALVLFGIGTVIRVRSEERLLCQAFGDEFEACARRVPVLFPRWS